MNNTRKKKEWKRKMPDEKEKKRKMWKEKEKIKIKYVVWGKLKRKKRKEEINERKIERKWDAR